MFGTSSTISGNSRSLLTFTIPALGTTTLSSALSVTTYTQVADTTLDLAGYTLTSTGPFNYNNGTINNFGTVSCVTFNHNGPTFTLTSGSIVCSTSFVITAGSFTLGALATALTTPVITQTAGDITLSKAATVSSTYTQTAGVLLLDGVDLTVGTFSSSGTGVRSVLFGSGNTGNIILTNVTSGAINVTMADMTNFSCSGPGGFRAAANTSRRFRIGSTSGGSINNAPNLTITSGFTELLIDTGGWIKTLDLTNFTGTLSGSTTASATSLNLQSMLLPTSGTFTNLTATMLDTGTINGNGRTIAALTINHISTTTFTGALVVAGTYTQTAGDVNFGGFNLSVTGSASHTSGTLSNIGVITCTTWTVNGVFNLTNGTLTPSTSFVIASGSFTYSGGTLSPVPTFTHTAGTVTISKAYALTTTGTYNFLVGALILNGYQLTTGIFTSSNSNFRSINFGVNNIVLTHTTAATVVLNIGTAIGFTVSGTGGFIAAADVTRTYAFGTTGGGTKDNSPNLSFSGSGTAVQTITTGSWFNKLDFGTTLFNPGTTTLNLNALTLSSGGTYTGISPTMVGTGVIDTNGKTIAAFVVNTPGTLTLGSNITCTSYTHVVGAIVYAGFTINGGAVVLTQGTLTDINLTCTSFTMSAGTVNINGGTINTPTFTVTSGTLNYNNCNLSSVTSFIHTAGDVNLSSNLTLANTSTYTFTAGTLNLAGFTLSTGIFSSTNANVRSILFGTGSVALVHPTVAQTVLSMAIATNFNFTGTGGFTSAANVTRTFTFGTTDGTFSNAVSLSITSGAEIPTLTTNSWFKTLDFTGSTCQINSAVTTINVDTLTLASGGTYTNLIPQFTRTQTWSSQHSKTLGGIGFNRLFNILTLDGTQTFTATSVCSLVTGTIDLSGHDLTVGVFNSSNTNIRSIVFGNNNIILATTTAGETVLSIADATNFSYSSITGGFISDATITRTYTFGTTSGSVFNSPNLLINSGSAIPTITTNSWFNKLDFTGSTCIPAIATLNLNSLTLASGGTYTNLSATMRTNGIITSSGKAIAALVINHSDVGITTLAGALTCTTQTYTAGNVDFANFNLTSSGAASYTSGAFSNLGILNCTTFTIAGAFTLTGGTITPSSTFTLTSGSFTYQAGTLSPVSAFVHTAGTVILNKSYALSTNGTYTLTGGALNLGAFNLTTGIFSSTGATVRSINFGTGSIILNHTTAAQTVLSMADVTNFTRSGTGGFISDAVVTRTFTFGTTGGSISNAPNLSITSGSAVPTTTDNSWVNTLDFTGSTCTPAVATVQVSTLILASGGTYTNLTPSFTRTQTWSMQFSKQLAGFVVNIPGGTLTLDGTQTYIATSLCKLSNGALDLGGYDLSIGTFSSNNSNTRSIIFGSKNIILSTTIAGALNVDMATATNFTYTGTGGFTAEANVTRTFTFGTTGGSATNSPNLTFTGTGTAVQTLTTASWFNKLDFGTTVFNPGTTTLNLDSLTLSATGTFSGITATIVGTGTIIGNGNTTLLALTINHTGTTTLGSNLSVTSDSTRTITLTAGSLDLNGYNLTVARFSSTGTGVRSILFGTNTITVTGSGGALSMADATNFTYTGTGGFVGDMTTVAKTFTFGTTGGSINNAPNLSITTGSFIPTLTTGSWFKKLDFTGSTCTPAVSTFNVDTLTLASGGTYTSLIPVFTRTQTWTAQFSKALDGIGFNLDGGTLTLDNTQTYNTTSTCVLTAGTLNLGGYDLTIGIFSSSNTNTRSIAFGTKNIILAHTTSATVNLSMLNATGFTYTGTGGFTAAANIARTFTFGTTGGSSTNAPNLSFSGSGTAVQTITTGSWFNKLDFGSTAFSINNGITTVNINSLVLSTVTSGISYNDLNVSMRGTGTITTNSANVRSVQSLTINHTGTTTLLGNFQTVVTQSTTLTSGTLNLNNYYLLTGSFVSSNSNVRSIDYGTTGASVIYLSENPNTTLLSMANATNFTIAGTNPYGFACSMSTTSNMTFVFGTTGGTSTNAPNLYLTGTQNPTLTSGSWFNKLDFTGGSFIIAATSLNLNSLTIPAGGIYNLNLTMVGSGTITSNGNYINGTLTINHSGTTTLAGALLVNLTTTLTSGTLNLNNFTLTASTFSSSNTNTRSIAFGTGNISLTQTVSGTVLDMKDMTNFTWTGTGGFVTINRATTQIHYAGTIAGGSASNAINLSVSGTGGTDPYMINSWFKNLNFNNINSTLTAGIVYVDTLTLSSAGTFTNMIPIFTRTQTWTAQFSKQLGGIGVNGAGVTLTLGNTQTYTATSACYLIAGTLNLGGYNLTIGRFISSNTNTRSIVFGTNNIILATTESAVVNLDLTTATGFTFTGTGGFTAAADRTRRYSVGTDFPVPGGETYTTPGTYSWTAPTGVTSVSVLAVGAGGGGMSAAGGNGPAGGGGGGGGLGWKNSIAVIPGQTYTVVVGAGGPAIAYNGTPSTGNGGQSYFISAGTVAGNGGAGGTPSGGAGGVGGTYVGDGGGQGGQGGTSSNNEGTAGGGGGAAGYAGNGGNGADSGTGNVTSGTGGGAGGGGSGSVTIESSGGGGGVGLFGLGGNGAGGAGTTALPGINGSGGTIGTSGAGTNPNGGAFGGGGGGSGGSQGSTQVAGSGGSGAVRIIWGLNRAFPATYVAAIYDELTTSSGSTGTDGGASTENAPNLSFTGSGSSAQTITSGSWFNNLNFGTTQFTIPVTRINVSTLTLSSGGTFINLTPVFTSTQTWTAQYSKQLAGIGVNKEGVTLTLPANQAYIQTSTLVVDAGTINLDSINFIFYNVISNGIGSRSITGAGSITYNSTWSVLYGPGFTGSDYTIYSLGSTFDGGGGSYGTLVTNSGILSVTGSNSFADIQSGSAAQFVLGIVDPYFMYNTLLLPSNGASLAQNNTFLDSSTNNFAITRFGNTTQGTFSPYGDNWSNYFDGTGDYLTAPANIAFAFGTGDFTIESWVYLTSTTPSSGRLICTRLALGTAAGTWSLNVSHTSMAFTEVVSGEPGPSATFTSILNTWAHVVAVRNAGVTTLYLNGTQVAQASQTTNFNNTSYPLYICNSPDEGFNAGYVSNIRIVKGTALYTSAFVPSTTPLTAVTNTSLLTCQSNRLIDTSSNDFTITKNGDVSVQRFSPFSPATIYSTDIIGGSGYFDGTGDYLAVANNASNQMGTGDWTAEAWIYITSYALLNPVFAKGGSTTDWFLATNNVNGRLMTGIGVTDYFATTGPIVSLNAWHHVALVRSGTTLTIYLDGVAGGTVTGVTQDFASTGPLHIGRGRDSSVNYLSGYVSNSRLVKGTAVYTGNFALPTTPVTAIANTSLLLNYTNAGIYDYAMINDLETVGNAQISTVQSKFGGSSMYFDGSGDGLLIPHTPQHHLPEDFTIEFWVYWNGAAGTHMLINKGGGLNIAWASYEIYIDGTTGHARFAGSSTNTGYDLGGESSAGNMGVVTANTWTHIALTRSGTSFRGFVNGTQGFSQTSSVTPYDTSPRGLLIGSSYVNTWGSTPNGTFVGYIDDLRITKGFARYTTNFAPPAESFIANLVTGSVAIEYLLVAGAGGNPLGGGKGGGGGGGGVVRGNVVVFSNVINVTVGAGGLPGTGANSSVSTSGGDGGASYITSAGISYTIQANGGGGGGGPGSAGRAGGSGGGGGITGSAGGASNKLTIVNATSYGNPGGSGGGDGWHQGGGGGAGGVAGNGYFGTGSAPTAGDGGAGIFIDMGGGVTGTYGAGHTGNPSGGDTGASGTVIIRTANTDPVGTATGSPTITTAGGYRLYQWTAVGTWSITF